MENAFFGRRRFPRRRFKRQISILFEGKYFIGQGIDVGEGGMLFESEFEISQAEGSTFLLNFILATTGICIVRAELRSYRSATGIHSYGVLFLNLDYEGKKGIREFIAAKSEQESEEERKLLISNQ